MADKCKAYIKQSYWPYGKSSQQCTNNAVKDGYCIIHHPEEKRKREKKRMDIKEKLFNKKSLNK